MDPLPIDPVLPEVVAAAASARRVVLEAPPGAGKTTRVPVALLDAQLASTGDILVSEPRRLAARLAARRVALERGERLGETIGYTVRFEDVTSRATRVRYVTDGVLLRRLVEDPTLDGVAAVVLDELHERHLANDLALALLRRLQATTRPELVLVAMSATLDAAAVAAFLDDCPRITSAGRLHPVTLVHLSAPDDRPLKLQVVSAVRRALREAPPGDVLVFVPGAGEIRACAEGLESLARESDLLVLPLHGELDLESQARAVERAARRKVVLATNVAESSVTIEGVTCVVDAGLTRVAEHSPGTGLSRLVTRKASRASAIQRAGRAGRTAPGLVLRLFTQGDFDRRPAQELPELARADLTEALLYLHGAGIDHPSELQWLEAPPSGAIDAAGRLLGRLGARDTEGRLTEVGRRLLRLPVHPRLARVLIEGERRGIAPEACLAVAILGERDPRQETRARFSGGAYGGVDGNAPSDLSVIAELVDEALQHHAGRPEALGLERRTVRSIDAARRQLERALRVRDRRPLEPERQERELAAALLAGFPDRVARRREPRSRELVLATGEPARLAPTSVVHEAPLLLALDAEGSGTGPVMVRLGCAIAPEQLLDLEGDLLAEHEELTWNPSLERVERSTRLSYGSIVLDEGRAAAPPSPEASRVLARAAQAQDWEHDALAELTARLALLRSAGLELEVQELDTCGVEALLAVACAGLVSFAELRATSLAERVVASLTPSARRALHEHAPRSLTLPHGRTLPIHYALDRPPWVESRLQDFFGQSATPRVARGRVAVTVHLLAPNQRAVQVTSDLEGFWTRHYPSIRRELMRRYPRHAWPEDGATATPPAPRRR